MAEVQAGGGHAMGRQRVASIAEVFSQYTEDDPELLRAHLNNLLTKERTAALPTNVLQNCHSGRCKDPITSWQWQVVADWMIDTLLQFHFTNEGAALAFHYLNTLIALGPSVTKTNIQQRAAACILLASKIDGYQVAVEDLRFAADNSFSAKDLLQTEVDILQELHFGLITVTPFAYMEVLVPAFVPMRRDTRRIFIQHAEFFMLNNLTDFECTTTPPSTLAAAGICTTLQVIPDRLGLAPEQVEKACDKIVELVDPNFDKDLFETSVAKMKMVFNDYQTHEQEQKSARESPTGVIDTPTPAVASEQPIVEAAAGNSSNGKRHSSPDDGANTGANAGAKRSKHN